jgi:LemA protein
MGMSKGKVIGIVVGVIVVIAVLAFVLWLVGTYNSLVNENEQVDAQWAEVTNQYQRKIDLIPALVSTLGNYSEFEQATLTNITALRSRWMNSSGEDQVNATNELDRQLVAIQVTFEAYPDLKTIEAVNNVMYELAGTENRITVARGRYNEAVKDFNAHIKRFPASWVAGWGDFEERSYYISPNAPAAP